MKVKFNRAALQEALNLVGSIIPSRTPKPILQCLRGMLLCPRISCPRSFGKVLMM
jgi:hypothetical protein